MTDAISLAGFATALLLPWMLGITWLYAALGYDRNYKVAWILGYGYLLGLFATTLILRLWYGAGLAPSFAALSATLVALTAIGAALALFRPNPTTGRAAASPDLLLWQKAVIALLMCIIGWRYLTLAQELLLRPLFPWDAWMNWAPKAVVWFHHQELVEFVSRGDWLNATGQPPVYTEGAANAWRYPITLPLVQLWMMLGLGAGDHTLIYTPWLFAPFALGMICYGHLRSLGASVTASVLAVYLLLNLPFLNVHTVLAGYADIWVAAAFTAAALALGEWHRSRQTIFLVLSLSLAGLCTLLKIPGLVMGVIILAVMLSLLIQLPGKVFWGTVVFVSVASLAVLLIGVDVDVPNLGKIAISSSGVQIPYIGSYQFEYHPVSYAMFDTIFLMMNWNMLGYAALFVLGLACLSRKSIFPASAEARALLLSLGFIFFVYYFTGRYKYALDYTQVNRALIYAAPLLVFLVCRALSTNNTVSHPPGSLEEHRSQ